MEQAEVGRLELLVPGGDPAELLGLAEQPLHTVSLPVAFRVPGPAVGVSVGLQRDIRVHVPVDAVAPEIVPVECLVPDQLVDHRDAVQRPVEHRYQQRGVARLARHNVHGQRRVLIRRGQHHLGAQPAATAAEGLGLGRPPGPDLFFFRRAPAACWCARTMVESISTRRNSPNAGSAVMASNSRRSAPDAAQRRKRLYTASQRPNSDGKSRQGTPVRARYKSASKKSRSGSPGGWPPLCRLACWTNGSIPAQSSSVSMYRMTAPPAPDSEI